MTRLNQTKPHKTLPNQSQRQLNNNFVELKPKTRRRQGRPVLSGDEQWLSLYLNAMEWKRVLLTTVSVKRSLLGYFPYSLLETSFFRTLITLRSLIGTRIWPGFALRKWNALRQSGKWKPCQWQVRTRGYRDWQYFSISYVVHYHCSAVLQLCCLE